jgi:uncharacterized protein
VSWLVAVVVTLGAALVQGTVGIGFAMVSVPILSLLDPRMAPVPQLLLAIPLAVATAWRERGEIDLSGVGWIVAGRIPGVLLGLGLLAIATQALLDATIACFVLIAVAILATGVHIEKTGGAKFGAGVLSGSMGLVASIGGPPLALLYSREEGPTVRSSLAAVFTIGLAMTIVARAVTGNVAGSDVTIAVVLLPALTIGFVLSGLVKDRVGPQLVRRSILVVSSAAAVGLLLRAM